jgi:ferredoxin
MTPEIKYTKEFVAKLQKATPKYENCGQFFHCRTCMAEIPDGISPRDWGSYEVAGCAVEVDKVRLGVVSVWCKRCGKLVWDSRHLKHAY